MKTIGLRAVILATALVCAAIQVLAIDEIPDKRMVSKGGVLYPQTGDSSQEIFKTPENARQMFPPGTLVGVLPADCMSASKGGVEFFRCDHDFVLKQEEHHGRSVYRVIEAP